MTTGKPNSPVSIDSHLQVLVATCGAWWLRHTAKAFEARNGLTGMWCTEKNATGLSPERFRRCWPFHLAMYPLYRMASDRLIEQAFHAFIPLWARWFKAQRMPAFNVMQSITGYCTEPFDMAESIGALKVADCPNSHP